MSAYRLIFQSLTVKLGALVCALGFGGFILWASFAPITKGIVAFGRVEVETKRKVIQHLEGGIIQEILVREGDQVEEGAPLIVLVDITVTAGRNQLAKKMLTELVSIDRLNALIEGQAIFDYTLPDDIGLEPSVTDDVIQRHRELFQQQQRTMKADIDVLNSRVSSLRDNVSTKQNQIDQLSKAANIVTKDLERKQALFKERMVPINEVTQLELEEARMQTELSRLRSEQSLAKSQIDEVKSQIYQTRQKHAETLNSELVQAKSFLLETQEQLVAAQDAVNRSVIYAPQAGKILNLEFTTTGGVVKPGERILEIVPSSNNLIAIVEISPADREDVYEEQDVRARLAGFQSWQSPPMPGIIQDISGDLKSSPRGDYQ